MCDDLQQHALVVDGDSTESAVIRLGVFDISARLPFVMTINIDPAVACSALAEYKIIRRGSIRSCTAQIYMRWQSKSEAWTSGGSICETQ